jgi:hypothetical protein
MSAHGKSPSKKLFAPYFDLDFCQNARLPVEKNYCKNTVAPHSNPNGKTQ